jgi:Fe-S oxidoreductase
VLANALAGGKLALRRRAGDSAAAYLDPTHAARSGRNPEAARTLLAAVLGEAPRELFWSRERGQPSGTTSLRHTHPAIAESLARARLADAQQAGVTTLFTEALEDIVWLNRFAGEYGIVVANLYEELAALIA